MKGTKRKPELKSYWLYLHPYVHISIKQNKAILYNTLNGSLLEYEDDKTILPLIKRINWEYNLYVIKLWEEEIDSHITRFINDIRRLYIGDLIDTFHRPSKPIQIRPMVNLQKTFDYLTTAGQGNSSNILVKDELKDYLNGIILYVNDRCEQSCRMCKDAYKQFLYCVKNNSSNNEITIDDITKLVNEVRNSKLYKLNIVGGNIFFHSKFIKLIDTLNRVRLIKEYCIHYLNIEDKPEYFDLLLEGDNRLRIFAHFPLAIDAFRHCMDLSNRYKIKKRFQFVIEKDEDILKAEEIISGFQIGDRELTPYYNGSNLAFFEKNVFLDKESIIESRPNMNDIFTRMTLNASDFKKLTILSNKKIYTNPNNPWVGKLGKDYIFDLIYKELQKSKSWTRIRKHVIPCKSCVFNALCPPISNYEYAIGRYNLCDIF